MFQFLFNSAICGFNVNKDIWENLPGEELLCRHEVGNSHDALSVAVLKEIVGKNTIIEVVAYPTFCMASLQHLCYYLPEILSKKTGTRSLII